MSDGDTSGDTASAFGGCDGGGFYVDTGVTLAISDAMVSNNFADCTTAGGGSGGGIYLAGTGASVILSNTTLTGNTAGSCGAGGALYTFGGAINATNSTISGNDSECSGGAYGGGVVVVGASSLTLRNVTLASNSDTVGSGVDAGANLAMLPSGRPTYPTVSIRNTIITHGVPAADGNCGTANSGPIPATSVGHNTSDDATCGFTASGDQQNVHPLLGALANNRGQTDTRALLAGSPAIDAGGNTGCPATDQRGVSRPQDGNGNGIAICDVGAYEGAAPIVTTGSATHVTRTRASVGGSVNPNSSDASFRIQYGTSTAYGSQTQVQDAGSGNTAVALRATLSGLKPGTKYHYRAVGTNADGTSHGVDRTFTTLPNPPDTEITKAIITSPHHKASFSFKAIGRASGFQCALTKPNQPKPAKSFSSCSSPKNYTNLKHGSYTFLVRAFNAGGFDRTPARRSFQIT